MITNAKDFYASIQGKRVAFCGIGGSNLPLISIFQKKGAVVLACDKRDREKLGETGEKLENQGVELHLGEAYLKNLNADIIFRTPGMSYYLPELVQAREQGVVVTSEMEVFFDLCPCRIYAVTGSDGKTTTTTIISEMLKAAGKTVHLGGNIGCPLLPKVEEIRKDDVAVVELSSFQLISMRKSPDVAVVTNLAPNHLDIHKDMQEYIDAKKNIILHQNAFGRAVLNLDNEITRGLAPLVRGGLSYFTRQHTTDRGVCLNGGAICHRRNGVVSRIMDVKDIRIPGNHNVENYMAAIAAVWGEVSPEQMRQVAESFPGVEHRAEFVRNVDGVDYYNDSIASSPTRTISGTLSLYSQKIILIAGGYDKKIPYDAMGPVVNEKVKLLILMGNTADKIQSAVTKAENYDPQVIRIIRVENMEEAVETAHRLAQKGDVVSLSPASASFDLYPNFAARGNHFKQLVNAL